MFAGYQCYPDKQGSYREAIRSEKIVFGINAENFRTRINR